MALQQHGTDEIAGLVDADVDPAAAVQESKTLYASSGGHDHDTTGTPTPAVLVVRQLRPTASGPIDFLVHIAASAGVAFPDGLTIAVSATTVDFSSPLPAGANKRIDLIYLDRAGVVQRALGAPTTGTPVPPTHDGIYPIAEIGPILSTTGAISAGMVKDVRPFLASGPLVHVKLGATDLGYAHTLVAGSNMSATLVAGVATLSASGGTGSPPDASTAVKGIVRVTVNPGLGLDPIALSANDPAVALIASAVQANGSVPFTADQSLGGHNLTNVGSLLFTGTGTVQAGSNANLNLVTTGTGKVRIVSPSALQLPSLASPTTPSVGDIWYDPTIDGPVVRTTAGAVPLSTVQTGSIGLAVTEIVGDPIRPPSSGAVGDVPTLDFSESVGGDETIRFSFQLPEDALLVENVTLRLVYCMAAAGAGNVSIGYDYTVVPVNGDLTPAVVTGNGTFLITPSGTAEILQADQSIVLPFGQLSTHCSVSVKLRRRSTDSADTRNGNWQLLYVNVLYAKKDISSQRNVVEVIDEVTSLGQVTGFQFRGNLVTVTEVSGVGVVDITDPNTLPATTTTLGITKIAPAPAVSGQPIAVGVNATYLPIQTEKDALAGTVGAPSGTNKYVTDADARIPSQNENDALVGTAGAPSNVNRFVTNADPRIPATGENDALVGTAGAGPSSGNPYVLADYANLPSSSEKAAMGGSFGTPSGSNTFVTRNDPLFVLTTGTRAFTAPQPGVDPTLAAHLATKAYVDSMGAALTGDYAAHVQNITQLQAVPPSARTDKQLRLVEDDGAIYRFDVQGTGGGIPPNVGLGQWYKVQAATQVHGQLLNLAADDHPQYSRVDGARAFTAPVGGVTPTLSSHLTTRGFTDGAYAPLVHATRHQVGGADQLNVTSLLGRLNDSQFITIQDEGSAQGQAHTLNVVGASGSVAVSAGVATLTLTGGGGGGSISAKQDGSTISSAMSIINFVSAFSLAESPAGQVQVSAKDASTSQKGVVLMTTAPAVPTTPLVVSDTDPRNSNARTPTAHKASHQTGGSDEISLAGLLGRASTSQFITIQDEGSAQGQAHTLNVAGATAAIAVSSGVATLTISAASALNVKDGGSTIVSGATDLSFDATAFAVTASPATQANVAPVFSTIAGTFCQGNDGRLSDARTPTAHKTSHQLGGSDEISLAGLSGRATTSQFITIQDEGVAQGQAHTLNVAGAAGSISIASGIATLVLTGGGGGSLAVKKDNTIVSSSVSVVDFTGFDVTESPAGETNVSMPVATDIRDGLMPMASVIKLDSIESGSQVNPVIQDEGVEVGFGPLVLNFVGPRVSVAFAPATSTATITLDATTLGGTLVAGRIPFASSSTTLTDSADFTWNNSTKLLSVNGDIDLLQHQLLNARLENRASAPTAGNTGRIFILTSSTPKKVQFDDGAIKDITSGSSHSVLANLSADDHTQYILVAGTRAFTGDQSMGGNKLTSLGTPTSGTDATNKTYVDGVYLAGAGLTKTGTTIDLVTADTSLTVNANDVAVNLNTTGGLETSTGVRVKLPTDSGLSRAAGGLSVSTDGSSIEVGSGTNQVRVKAGGVTDAMLATSYIKADGTRAFTGDQSHGGFQITSFRVENLALGSFPAASSGNKGRPLFDSTNNLMKWSNGTAFIDPLDWANASGTRAAGGDLSGSLPSPTVNSLTLGGSAGARGALAARGASAWGNLALGTNGQLVSSNGTDVVYQTLGGDLGGTFPTVTVTGLTLSGSAGTRGDIPVKGASVWGRIAVGSNNTVLTSNGTDPVWSTVPDAALAVSYLKTDGTRALTGALDLGTHQIHNVVDPSTAQDAATKAYVDAAITGGGSVVVKTNTADITVDDNTGTTQIVDSYTIPASTLVAQHGYTVDVYFHGDVSVITGESFTYDIVLDDGTTVYTLVQQSVSFTQTQETLHVQAKFVCRTTGGSGTVKGSSDINQSGVSSSVQFQTLGTLNMNTTIAIKFRALFTTNTTKTLTIENITYERF